MLWVPWVPWVLNVWLLPRSAVTLTGNSKCSSGMAAGRGGRLGGPVDGLFDVE